MGIEAVKEAIRALPEEERRQLEDWLAEEWDQEMERDFSPTGQGRVLIERIDAEINAGKFRPINRR
jgi:hypothetical protein